MSGKPKAASRSTNKANTAGATAGAARNTRATSSRSTPTPPLADPAKKKTTRKPFLDRNTSPEGKSFGVDGSMVTIKGKGSVVKVADFAAYTSDIEREPIRAFLRIRPQGDEESVPLHSKPYLEQTSSTAVRMSDPSSSQSTTRLSSLPQSSVYTFSHVFPPETSQSDFFTKTTLPLVKDVLEGQSGLLFAYGVTNSGKTYTVQGGNEEGSAGILPRTLDVIFNSIDGLHGDGRFRPVRLQGVEATPSSLASSQSSQYSLNSEAAGTALADILSNLPPSDPDTDPTTFKLDRNHEYTIWLSYTEIYNEKVYDLFASVDDPDATTTGRSQLTGIPRPTSTFLNTPLPSNHSKPLLLTRKALLVKPCPVSENDGDGGSAGKYVAGLRQLRVTSASQAKALLRLGQMHRQVFGTLANSQSSRSHAIVTIKVLRVHKGEKNDPTSILSSRLTLVDLAGSERTRNTQTSGERLREAGNINKSLMVLGQCMETMRANQRTVARSLNSTVREDDRLDTRDVKRSLAIVPFRHSKLTEVLMDYFVGEGRAVMIVNVNPYDTGYDENSHVMKFSAIAREVATTAPTAVPRPISTIPRSKDSLNSGRSSDVVPHRRKVTISTGGPGHRVTETHLEVLEEDEEPDEGDEEEDDEPINPLVDALFDEIESLRLQLFESEMRSVVIEAQTREEIMEEMEDRMKAMEQMYTRRLMQEVEQHEMKMDAKIDMLQRSGMLIKKTAPAASTSHESLPDTEELDDISEDDEEEELELEEEKEEEGTEFDELEEDSDVSYERSPSPLAGKRAKQANSSSTSRQSRVMNLEINAESEPTEAAGPTAGFISESQDQPMDVTDIWPTPPNSQGPEDEEPHPLTKAKARAKPVARRSTRSTRNSSLSGIVQKTEALALNDDDDDSVVIIPNKKVRQTAIAHAGPDAEYIPQKGESDTIKKKKRQLSKKAVVTEEELERVIASSESQGSSRPLRRSTRGKA
ncbi:kinesin-domain-containing protein [Trametopsis cervina]|nr:kinesin-domain-containing protein [Trametopsis cervina]